MWNACLQGLNLTGYLATGVLDLLFAREEHEDIPGVLMHVDLYDGAYCGFEIVPLWLLQCGEERR